MNLTFEAVQETVSAAADIGGHLNGSTQNNRTRIYLGGGVRYRLVRGFRLVVSPPLAVDPSKTDTDTTDFRRRWD